MKKLYQKSIVFIGITVLTAQAGQAMGETYTLAETSPLTEAEIPTLSAMNAEFNRLSEAVVPSVVSIIATRVVERHPIPEPLEQFFGGQLPDDLEQTALGSGVILSQEGHIVTNLHTVAQVDEIEVQLSDGRSTEAQKIASDPLTDIAVLKIEMDGLTPLALGDSDRVQVGDLVFAVGNPFGLQGTVTNGIISATERRPVGGAQFELLQTTAEVNPGNSGGPLVNIRGEIIGINMAIATAGDPERGAGWQGIGFAIPSNIVRDGWNSLVKHGRILHGYLGVKVRKLTEEQARELDLESAKGTLIVEVMPDSPAERAGLQSDDIIVRFNDHLLQEPQDLRQKIRETEVGSEVELEVLRSGERLTVQPKIEEIPIENAA
jgi:serine protease Do